MIEIWRVIISKVVLTVGECYRRAVALSSEGVGIGDSYACAFAGSLLKDNSFGQSLWISMLNETE
jgi:hypothetical protein